MQNDGQNAGRGAARNISPVIDFSLLTAMDAASRRLLSRYGGETLIVGSCEPEGQLAQSIAGVPGSSVPAVCEPCGVWISLEAGQKR